MVTAPSRGRSNSPVPELVNRSGREWPSSRPMINEVLWAGSDRSAQALAHATHSVTTARSRPSSEVSLCSRATTYAQVAADLRQASTSARSRSSCMLDTAVAGALRSKRQPLNERMGSASGQRLRRHDLAWAHGKPRGRRRAGTVLRFDAAALDDWSRADDRC